MHDLYPLGSYIFLVGDFMVDLFLIHVALSLSSKCSLIHILVGGPHGWAFVSPFLSGDDHLYEIIWIYGIFHLVGVHLPLPLPLVSGDQKRHWYVTPLVETSLFDYLMVYDFLEASWIAWT